MRKLDIAYAKTKAQISIAAVTVKLISVSVFSTQIVQTHLFLNPRLQAFSLFQKVQVGKDQEKAQSEKDSHSKNRGGKKPN